MASSRRPLRIALLVVAALLVVSVAAVAVVILSFDPNSYKPQIAQAVKHATGRDLALNGRISLKPSLWPTINIQDATFSNPPGFSRPQMASLQSLDLQLALLPLLSKRIEINRLILIHPDILLETDAAGHANWQLTPEVSPTAPAGTQAPVKSGGTTTAVSVNSISIQDGTLAYRDDKTAKVVTLGLPKLDVTADSADSPLHLDANASYNGTAFNLAGDTGSLTRLQDAAATTPWPVNVALTMGAAKVTAAGSLTQPLQGKGYDLAVNGTVPDVAALTPLLQGYKPPPLHDVSFAAKLADKGAALPDVSALTLHIGASDLGGQVPGLTLTSLNVAAAAVDQPAKADATGQLKGQPFSLTASTGPLVLLMPGAKPAAFPLDATVQAAGGTVSAKGNIADAQALSGVAVVFAGRIPDLAALSPLLRRPLPAIKQVAFGGNLADQPGGLRHGALIRGLALNMAEGDVAGDVGVAMGAKTSLTAVLKSSRIDLDALKATLDQMPAAPGTAPQPAPAAAPAHPREGRLFPDTPIPFDLLRTADADLKLDVADLHSGGVNYRTIDTHAVVNGGKLVVDPFSAELPGGHLAGSMTADATQPAPPVRLRIHAPGLALKTILTAVDEPSFASGNLDVSADLRGAGDSPHAIAATLDGFIGLAIPSGTIDNRLLGSLLGKVMDTLNALNLVGRGGTSELRCFGFRMDFAHGVGALKAMALSSSLLTMTGAGSVNLGQETLALTLHPQARVAGTGVVIPLNVTGPIRSPAVNVNRVGAAESNAGAVAGAVVGSATPLGIVGGLLGSDKLAGGGSTDICPAALAAAHGEAVPEAAVRPAAPAGANPARANPGAVLKNLFR